MLGKVRLAACPTSAISVSWKNLPSLNLGQDRFPGSLFSMSNTGTVIGWWGSGSCSCVDNLNLKKHLLYNFFLSLKQNRKYDGIRIRHIVADPKYMERNCVCLLVRNSWPRCEMRRRWPTQENYTFSLQMIFNYKK